MEKHAGVSIQKSGSSILTPDSWILDSQYPVCLQRGFFLLFQEGQP